MTVTDQQRLDLPRVLLASSSPARRSLLNRLGIRFEQLSPDVDETVLPGEKPEHMVARLARRKADAVAAREDGAVIIASDQTAVRADEVLGKPGNRENAIAQLVASSGRDVRFLTAACVLDTRSDHCQQHLDTTVVQFRNITPDQAARYVDKEQPFGCAGAFRSESLGIVLFAEIQSTDPTALIGLPLIWLSGALRRAGVDLI